MSETSKTKSVHYKSALISGGIILQDVIKSTIGPGTQFSKPKSRQQKPNPESETVVFINRFEDYNGVTFGQLVTLEAGRVQQVITVDDSADYYSIDAMTSDKIPSEGQGAANAAEKRREFLDSVLYFGVLGNHVVLLQSASLRSNHLEAHLTWLLSMHAKTIQTGSMLVLNDKAAEETYERLRKAPVKSVRIGAPLTSDMVIDPSDVTDARHSEIVMHEKTEAARVRVVPRGAAAEMLMAALKDGFFEKLNLDEALDESNIQVALEVTYNRKTSKAGHKVLDSIATSLRHLPESDVRIDLEGGGTIRGSDLRLSGPIKVEYNNGLINEALLFHAMHQWLYSKVNSSEVDPKLGQ
ncbi:hypothetical protein L2Y94_05805 [Luteibacter aegosomatis]|uniref:hypothetical protein n=1 Tax=Luteibacter aegosomatis TaxID=2911537 RepID=UPI001FFB8F2B|nr:hypothetical protein [Luteibacter aegosomatis]UPG86869.1 hypothetical protein L2Y94_05805 [Luteibacter aegosomatis]